MVDNDCEKGNTALMLACDGLNKCEHDNEQKGTKDKIVRILLNDGANVDKCNAKGEDALSLAYKFGREDAIKMLKDAGAIMNKDAFNAAHSLSTLCGLGRSNTRTDLLVVEFLDAGVDVNGVESEDEYNATQWANRWRRTWLVSELRRRGGKL
jgi:ankyrin repeat protein